MSAMLRIPVLAGLWVVALGLPSSSAAPPAVVTEVLSWVPQDSAIFVHVDIQKLWKSPILERLRKANPNKLYDKLRAFHEAVGIPPEDVATFTLFMPKLKGPGDQQATCFALTLNKPYDSAKLVTSLNTLAEKKTIPEEFSASKFKKVRDGVYAINEGARSKEEVQTLFMFDNPNRVVILGPRGHELAKPAQGEKNGPLADALAAATTNTVASLGLNWASMPDELRQDGVPPQFEPFKPLFHADVILATIAMSETELTIDAHARCSSRAKALEAEKSLGVLKSLIQTLVTAGIQEGEKQNEPGLAKLLDLGRQTQAIVRSAKITSDDTQANLMLRAKLELDVTPLIEVLSGGRVPSANARAVTQNNLKQLALGMHNYHDTHGSMPTPVSLGKKGKMLHSWRVAILPYLDQVELYKQFKLEEPWDSEHNKKVFADNPMPAVYRVQGHSKPDDKTTSMQLFRGNGAMFDLIQPTKFQSVTDGTSNTIMIVLGKTSVPWTKPDDLEFDPKANPAESLLFMENVTHTAFGDGSVRTMKATLKPATWKALITKSGGEVVSTDD